MNEVIALTGVTGAMGSEAFLKLLESERKFKFKILVFNKEKKKVEKIKKFLSPDWAMIIKSRIGGI